MKSFLEKGNLTDNYQYSGLIKMLASIEINGNNAKMRYNEILLRREKDKKKK